MITYAQEKDRGFVPSYRKEGKLWKGFHVVAPTEKSKNSSEQWLKMALDVRFYWAGHTCYCAFWGCGTSGTGRAGGYGYEKTSAAFEQALHCAGFSGFESFACTGCFEGIVKELMAYARVKKYQIIDFYG
jgi:hypothetical protein